MAVLIAVTTTGPSPTIYVPFVAAAANAAARAARRIRQFRRSSGSRHVGDVAAAAMRGRGEASSTRASRNAVCASRVTRCCRRRERLQSALCMDSRMAPRDRVQGGLQVSDMDRHYYASPNLTLAQHPSETDGRLMVRLLAFALFADERLEFRARPRNEEEPDLGAATTPATSSSGSTRQPDESASARPADVRPGGGGDLQWQRRRDLWEKNASALSRLKNLTVSTLMPQRWRRVGAAAAGHAPHGDDPGPRAAADDDTDSVGGHPALVAGSPEAA